MARNKDFFADRDTEFVRHRDEIANQLVSIADILDSRPTGNVDVLKVTLRRSAWAKSYRPFGVLFRPGYTPVIGGDDLGEVLVEVHPEALRRTKAAVERAEEVVRVKIRPDSGRPTPYPTAHRSETGAIERLALYGPADRRRFSVEQAVEWLANPMTGGAYHVDLFEMLLPYVQRDMASNDRQYLYSTFVEGLQNLGPGLLVRQLAAPNREPKQISLRLDQSLNPPALFLQGSAMNRHRDRDVAPFDPDVMRHQRILTFLDNHPLVRSIELPPIINHANTFGHRLASLPVSAERE